MNEVALPFDPDREWSLMKSLPGSRVEYSDVKLARPEYMDSSSPSRRPLTMFLKLRERLSRMIEKEICKPDCLPIS